MVTTDGVDSDLTPTPSTIRQKVNLLKEDAQNDTQALIQSMQAWVTMKESADMQTGCAESARKPPGIRSMPFFANEDNVYEQAPASCQDIDRSVCRDDYTKDEQIAKDEKLLELLGEMVKQRPPDGTNIVVGASRAMPLPTLSPTPSQPAALGGSAALCGSGFQPSGSSSNSGPRPPPHGNPSTSKAAASATSRPMSPSGMPEDAEVALLIQACGEAYAKVVAEAEEKWQTQSRLISELQQLQERSERQFHESNFLTQRLIYAKHQLEERLQEAAWVNQELRARINNELESNELLRMAISEGLQGMHAKADDLNRQIAEASQLQAMMVVELQAATDSQACLQSELQSERVATWKQSTDVVMAFAGRVGPADVEASVSPTNGISRSRRGFLPTLVDLANIEATSSPSSPSSSSSKRRPPKADAVQEEAQLEGLYKRKAKRVAELTKELALDEAARANLDWQLEEVSDRIKASGLSLHVDMDDLDERVLQQAESPDWEECMGLDIESQLHSVETLRRDLLQKEAHCRRIADEQREACDALLIEREEMVDLRERVKITQAEAALREDRTAQVKAVVASQRAEIASIEASLLEERRVTRHQTNKLRAEVERRETLLKGLKDHNDKLLDELEIKQGGCFGRWSSAGESPSNGYTTPNSMPRTPKQEGTPMKAAGPSPTAGAGDAQARHQGQRGGESPASRRPPPGARPLPPDRQAMDPAPARPPADTIPPPASTGGFATPHVRDPSSHAGGPPPGGRPAPPDNPPDAPPAGPGPAQCRPADPTDPMAALAGLRGQPAWGGNGGAPVQRQVVGQGPISKPGQRRVVPPEMRPPTVESLDGSEFPVDPEQEVLRGGLHRKNTGDQEESDLWG